MHKQKTRVREFSKPEKEKLPEIAKKLETKASDQICLGGRMANVTAKGRLAGRAARRRLGLGDWFAPSLIVSRGGKAGNPRHQRFMSVHALIVLLLQLINKRTQTRRSLARSRCHFRQIERYNSETNKPARSQIPIATDKQWVGKAVKN